MNASRRTLLATVGAAMAGMAGCLGSSGGDDNGGDNGGDDSEPEGPQGDVEVEGAMSDSITVDSSARFEDATVDENLVVEGTITNDGDSTVSAELTLTSPQFRRSADDTIEIAAGESSEFEVVLNAVYAPQFEGYTLTVNASGA
jgi:hypothetical protein